MNEAEKCKHCNGTGMNDRTWRVLDRNFQDLGGVSGHDFKEAHDNMYQGGNVFGDIEYLQDDKGIIYDKLGNKIPNSIDRIFTEKSINEIRRNTTILYTGGEVANLLIDLKIQMKNELIRQIKFMKRKIDTGSGGSRCYDWYDINDFETRVVGMVIKE